MVTIPEHAALSLCLYKVDILRCCNKPDELSWQLVNYRQDQVYVSLIGSNELNQDSVDISVFFGRLYSLVLETSVS